MAVTLLCIGTEYVSEGAALAEHLRIHFRLLLSHKTSVSDPSRRVGHCMYAHTYLLHASRAGQPFSDGWALRHRQCRASLCMYVLACMSVCMNVCTLYVYTYMALRGNPPWHPNSGGSISSFRPGIARTRGSSPVCHVAGRFMLRDRPLGTRLGSSAYCTASVRMYVP